MPKQPPSFRKQRLLQLLPDLMAGDEHAQIEINNLYFVWLRDKLAPYYGVDCQSVDDCTTLALFGLFQRLKNSEALGQSIKDPEAYLVKIGRRKVLKLIGEQYHRVKFAITRIILGNLVQIEVPGHELDSAAEIKLFRVGVAPSLEGKYANSSLSNRGAIKSSNLTFRVIDPDLLELNVRVDSIDSGGKNCGFLSTKRKKSRITSLSPRDEESVGVPVAEGQQAESLAGSVPDLGEFYARIDPDYIGFPDLEEDKRSLVFDGIRELKPKEQELLLEVYYRRTPLEAIASHAGVTLDAIRRRLSNALDKARAAIERTLDEEWR